jgi:hypothetical protein
MPSNNYGPYQIDPVDNQVDESLCGGRHAYTAVGDIDIKPVTTQTISPTQALVTKVNPRARSQR